MLLDANRNVKIIDFGFSICIPNDKKLKIFCGTPSYMSPEIVSKTEYNGAKADCWALGILLYTLLCGKFPFKGINDNDLFKKIKRNKFELPFYLSEESKRLITNILQINPHDRPTASEVINIKKKFLLF